MSSGGREKENFSKLAVRLPEKEAREWFVKTYNRDPDRVTCLCCGEDYEVYEKPHTDGADLVVENPSECTKQWSKPHPNDSMTPETDPTPIDSAEAEQPASAGCAPTAGSEIPPTPTPAAIAVEGYLQNRQTLCEHMATISSTYDREKDRRKSIVEEIEKIDRCVARILDSQNSQARGRDSVA